MADPPPPPPPHGHNPRPPGTGLPDGNYDIFIIPPHASGGGFLYLPSMQPHRNSFLMGVACTLAVIGVWDTIKQWVHTLIRGGGVGVMLLIVGTGVAGWAWGKTQGESTSAPKSKPREGGQTGSRGHQHGFHQSSSGSPPFEQAPPPRPDPHTHYQSYSQYSEHYNSSPPPHPPPPPPPQQPHDPDPNASQPRKEQAPEPEVKGEGPADFKPECKAETKSEAKSAPESPRPETKAEAKAAPKAEAKAEPKPAPSDSAGRSAQFSAAASGWEKAREEMRKREEERKRAEELKRKREEMQKVREEAERTAKAKAEKEKWEQARAREKEQREREARERIIRERLEKEKQQRAKEAQERAEREAAIKATKAASQPAASKPAASRYEKPTAKSYVGTDDGYSFRPYDTSPRKPNHNSSASSVSGVSDGSYAHSHSTARTTPPPSVREPYSTTDPDKVHIKAVYLFSDSFPLKPVAQLVANQGVVTDGLVLRITTEGLFIDDDVRGVPQREWDVKAWTLKLVEDGIFKSGNTGQTFHLLRATSRDLENKKYTFILDESEAYKVALGIQRLRKGSQVRSLGISGLKEGEIKNILAGLGWI